MILSSIGRCGLLAVAALGFAVARTASAAETKNIIVFISDGGGFNSYRAASYYQHGRLGAQTYDRDDWSKYGSLTLSLNKLNGSANASDADEPVYDPAKIWAIDSAYAAAIAGGPSFKSYSELKNTPTDSAAAGTAMAVGAKVYNGAINYVPDYNLRPRPARGRAISEVAKSLGKSTGIVTSVYWCDATPSTFGGAHSSGRGNKRDIANEMLNSGTLDLIMGGGNPEYDTNGAPREPKSEGDYDMVGGSFTWDLLRTGRHSEGWKLIQSKGEFEAFMSGPTPAKIVGIPRVTQTLQQQRQTRDWNRDGLTDEKDARSAAAFTDPFIPTVPTLTTMTKAALNALDGNPKGFFVMIEGGAVDWAGHANQPGRMIEEMIDFNRAIEAAEEWVNRNSSWEETLIIITSDHETGLLLGLNSDMTPFDPVINRGAGRMPGMHFNSGSHSNSLVPLKVRGAGANLFEKHVKGRDPMHGRYVDNTSIYDVMKSAIGGGSANDYKSGGNDNGGYDGGGYGDSPYGGGSYSPRSDELLFDSAGGGAKGYGSSKPSTRPSDSMMND